MPSYVRSSVDSKASNFGSFAIRPPTKSSDRKAVAGGQWIAADSIRFANAAERQGGAAVPNVRGEKMMFSARKSMSATECPFVGRNVEVEGVGGGASISVIRLSGRIMAYNREMKSFRSIFKASPATSS